MGRVELENGLRAVAEPPVRGEHLLELPVGAKIGRDQTGHAVGQALGRANLGDLVPQRLLEEGEQRRDFAGRLGRSVRPLDEAIDLMSAAPWLTDLNGLPSKPAAVETQKASTGSASSSTSTPRALNPSSWGLVASRLASSPVR